MSDSCPRIIPDDNEIINRPNTYNKDEIYIYLSKIGRFSREIDFNINRQIVIFERL